MRNSIKTNKPLMTTTKPKNPKMIRAHAFKKGSISNPRGRGASIPIKKEMRKYTAAFIAEIYNRLLELNTKELRTITINPDVPHMERIMAKALLRDFRRSDTHYTKELLERIVGPIVFKQEFTGAGGSALLPPQIMVYDAPVAIIKQGTDGQG